MRGSGGEGKGPVDHVAERSTEKAWRGVAVGVDFARSRSQAGAPVRQVFRAFSLTELLVHHSHSKLPQEADYRTFVLADAVPFEHRTQASNPNLYSVRPYCVCLLDG